MKIVNNFRRFLMLIIGWSLSQMSYSQSIQNLDFEDWAITDSCCDGLFIQWTANGWHGGYRSSDSYSGNYAAAIEPMLSCGIGRNYMVYGDYDFWLNNMWAETPDFSGSGASIDFKPAFLHGYFKFESPQMDDSAKGYVILRKFIPSLQHSIEVGRGEIVFNITDNYTPFTIQITDLQPGMMPDSVVIAFSSGLGYNWDWENDNLLIGTLFIDKLRLDGNQLSAVNAPTNTEFKVFPNPVKDQLNFSFSSTAEDNYVLELINMAGQIVLQENIQPGAQQKVDVSRIRSGTYVGRIRGTHTVYANTTIIKDECFY